MRCVSWNVNGIRAVLRKGIEPWTAVDGADVVALQETKANPSQLTDEVLRPAGWKSVWASAVKRGYSGTALYYRGKPDEIIEGMGVEAYDAEGRFVALRFAELVVVSAYFPNSQDKGKRLDYKLGFCKALEEWLAKMQRKKREVLLLGDYNIAHEPIDLARPKPNEGSPGYLPEERAWFSRYLELGFRDVFREKNPNLEGAYTWWSFRSGARARNVGWRLDYATTTPKLGDQVRDVVHHPDILGSDHCPLHADL